MYFSLVTFFLSRVCVYQQKILNVSFHPIDSAGNQIYLNNGCKWFMFICQTGIDFYFANFISPVKSIYFIDVNLLKTKKEIFKKTNTRKNK